MSNARPLRISRRAFLATGGALIFSFSLSTRLPAAAPQGKGKESKTPPLPGSLKKAPMLDSWIRIGADGTVTVFTGKAELGQGVKTALIQIASEELSVEPRRIHLITADTAQTPNEGYTSGSQSMSDSGVALLNAAAQVRALLTELASARLGTSEGLAVQNGSVRAPDGRSVSYAELVKGEELHVPARAESSLKDPRTHTVMGRPMQRVDIPAKVTGGPSYVHDLRLPGMVHARVVRPPGYGAQLQSADTSRIEKLPGVLKIVRNGSYLAVVAEREYQAVTAARALAKSVTWQQRAKLPPQPQLYDYFQKLPAEDYVILGESVAPALGPGTIEATYRRPYQMHGSIGPSCAVALYKDDMLKVWSHTQGVYPLRNAIAELVRLPPERVRCIHMEGSGCYGHNAADDAGADAALIAVAYPGRPVRVQWMREDEHAWEPYGSAMVSHARARIENGDIAQWEYEVWSNTHSTRPAPAGNLAPAWSIETPFAPPSPKPIPLPAGGGDRNAIPLYKIPNARVIHHFVPTMPLRVSALRSLGAYMNVFSIESFIDEVASAVHADPVAFRLRHLDDPRAHDVIRLAADRFGWSRYTKQTGRGRGFGFARYKNYAAYCAVACEVEVERETGRIHVLRAVAATDSGEAVNPDGIRNQVEGGIVQSLSWTLYESVTFDDGVITSRDWSSYPILRFSNVPDSIEVHVVNRLGLPFLGTGEAAQGPAAGAIANAVADATGVRIRELPLSPRRVKQALGA